MYQDRLSDAVPKRGRARPADSVSDDLAARPFLVDLQHLRDDLLRQAASLAPETTSAQVTALLGSFAHSIEQALARGGVEVLRPEVGSPFDGSCQRLAGAVLAPRAELDGTVAEVLSDGYLDTTVDRAVTRATVRVYRCPSRTQATSGPA